MLSSWLYNQSFLLGSLAFSGIQTPSSIHSLVHSLFFCLVDWPTITWDWAMGNKTIFLRGLAFLFVDLPLLNTTELVKTSRMFVCIWQTIASTRKMLTLSGNCEELFILFYSPYWIKNLSLWNYKAAIVDSFMSYSVTFVNKVGQSDLEFF